MYIVKRFGYCTFLPNASLPWKCVAVTSRHALLKEKSLLLPSLDVAGKLRPVHLKRFGYSVFLPNANLPWKYVAVTFRHALLKEKRLLLPSLNVAGKLRPVHLA